MSLLKQLEARLEALEEQVAEHQELLDQIFDDEEDGPEEEWERKKK